MRTRHSAAGGAAAAHGSAVARRGLGASWVHGAVARRQAEVEAFVEGREIECSVLGNRSPLVSVPGEIVPQDDFYSYRAKYIDLGSELTIPAELSKEKTDEVRTVAVRAFKALGCSGMARVDFLLERETERLYLNELNTIPGFTTISMYAKLWEASGVGYVELVERLMI